MENINGIQVDVSAVLADKIAEIAVATISKEKMEEIGKRTYDSVMYHEVDRWNNVSRSPVEKLAVEKFYKEVSKYFDELITSEEYQKKAKEEAEKIIEEMKTKIHDNLVNTISGQLSSQYISPYGGVFRNNVEQIVMSIIQRQ